MDDRSRVAELLGRTPRGDFTVVVRNTDGDPVVVRNEPFLDDGTPMPTRFYLVGEQLVRAVSRLEAAGGVRRAETEVPATAIAATHAAYERERDSAIPDDHDGPRPYGGVGGTRQGVKCLHAHVAHTLAGGDDPVGTWALQRIAHDVALDELRPRPGIPDDSATAHVPVEPGVLTFDIDDERVVVTMAGGGQWTMPVGPVTLLDGPLERHDPPRPEHLTNALGIVHDQFENVVTEAPIVLAAPSVAIAGHHAAALARVEVGTEAIPDGYELARTDADEVFRTLVVEPIAERAFNPGLADDDVETVIGTLCVVLAVMRRMDIERVRVVGPWH